MQDSNGTVPVIDERMHALIPPLAADIYAALEKKIIAEGCRDALVVWAETGVLLDGRHRLRICNDHGIPYRVTAMSFPDETAATIWMLENQMERRNATPDQFRMMLGERYRLEKQTHGGARRPSPQSGDLDGRTVDRIAAEHGVSKNTVERAAKDLELVEESGQREAVVSGQKTISQVKREAKEAKREARRSENRAKVESATPLTSSTEASFATIVIDPPWDWGDEGDADQLGRARPDYATMTKQQLIELPVAAMADTDCHVYLWITNRSLPKGFELLEAWGFRYITALTWVKPSFGMGNYFRGQTEHVLFGVKGSQPLRRKDVGTVFRAPRGPNGHSSKPLEFYDLVESCSPGPYLEMFSRSERSGWIGWGQDA